MNCTVIGHKSIHEIPHHLQEFEEARGQLLQVHEAEGQIIAFFSWGTVSLPAELAGELHELIGRRVGIIRLDGKYRARPLVVP